jgi:hypothetical protein
MAKIVSIGKTLTFRITLEGIKPEIWRSFVVKDDISLSELHETIQTVMGWTNTHLYSFIIKKTEYTDEETVEDLGRGKVADSVSVRSLKLKKGETLEYIYDFGDDWIHKLKVESVSNPESGITYPVCLAGARSCPPEDCGGPYGYEDFLNILSDPNHEEYESMKEWAGPYFNPEEFDLALTNDLLRNDPKDDTAGILKKLSREHMHEIWELAKKDQLDDLSDEDKLLAQIMIDHEDEFFNDFEFSDVLAERDYDPDTEVNPFLHITLHAIVENQLKEKEPIELYQFYNSMKRQKVSNHDTIHLIGRMLAPLMFSVTKGHKEFDMNRYSSMLKKCKSKRSDKIPDVIDREFESYFGE